MPHIAKYRDFTWGKFEPFTTLQGVKRWSQNFRKFTMGLILGVKDAFNVSEIDHWFPL